MQVRKQQLELDMEKQREKNQINKIRNENGEITIDNTEIQRIDHKRLLSAMICQ